MGVILSDTCSDVRDFINPEAIMNSSFFPARGPPAEAHKIEWASLVIRCKPRNSGSVIVDSSGHDNIGFSRDFILQVDNRELGII